MKKYCVVTGTRADYGIMSGIMQRLKNAANVTLQVVATNMHLSEAHGMTVREIFADGFNVDYSFPLPLDDDSPRGTVLAMSEAMMGFADAYSQLQPDMILILGDRFEMLAAASAAAIFGIPVAHFHGGEITEGAYDDSIRHAISKLATYHFTSTEEYRRRVIQMGEEPERVWNAGSPAVDTIAAFEPMSREEIEASLGVEMAEDYIVATFHPVTMQPGEAETQTQALLEALDEVVMAGSEVNRVRVIFTMPNSDTGGRTVGAMIRSWCDESQGRAIAVKSLGRKRYYSAVAHCAAVVGNSSSGLIEAPSFGVPTLNIGDRQKGRARGNTVTDVECDKTSIAQSLRYILTDEVRRFCKDEGCNPYQKQGAVDFIVDTLLKLNPQRSAPKHFYDL